MPSHNKQNKKAMAQSAAVKAASAPPAAAAPHVGAAAAMTCKNITTLRAEAAEAQQFATWAEAADDDEAPAQLFYPKPTGKGVWSWRLKAAHDAQLAAAALAAADAKIARCQEEV